MSTEERPTEDTYSNHRSRHKVTFNPSETGRRSQASRLGSNHDEERERIAYERWRRDRERMEIEILEKERERLERDQAQRDAEQGVRAERLRRPWQRIERDQSKKDDFEDTGREWQRLERDQAKIDEEPAAKAERLRREQWEQRARDQILLDLGKEELLRRREELSRREREVMEREDRVKVVRRDRRTNSGRTISEPRQIKVERTLSSGLSAAAPDEPKSFLSRWSSLLSSSPAKKIDTVVKVEAAPKNEKSEPQPKSTQRKVEAVPKSEPQPRSTQGSAIDLEGYFLQPAEDSHLQKSVFAISDSIDQHVYNHYGNHAIRLRDDTFLKVVQIGNESLRLPKALLNQEAFRLAAIRRLIAGAMIENISLEGDPDTTFLPKEVVSLLAMVPVQSTEKFRFAASSMFCRIAANLLRLSQSGESQAYGRFRYEQVKKASVRLHEQLSALANLDSNELARREQLEAIMMKAAQFGTLLLLQPATYQFEWLVRSSAGSSFDDQGRGISKAGPFTIFPALIKTGDNTGRELRKAQLVCKPEYMDEDDLVENDRV